MLEVEYLLLVKLKRQVIVEQRKEEKKGEHVYKRGQFGVDGW